MTKSGGVWDGVDCDDLYSQQHGDEGLIQYSFASEDQHRICWVVVLLPGAYSRFSFSDDNTIASFAPINRVLNSDLHGAPPALHPPCRPLQSCRRLPRKRPTAHQRAERLAPHLTSFTVPLATTLLES
jgi:hypothetical protein